MHAPAKRQRSTEPEHAALPPSKQAKTKRQVPRIPKKQAPTLRKAAAIATAAGAAANAAASSAGAIDGEVAPAWAAEARAHVVRILYAAPDLTALSTKQVRAQVQEAMPSVDLRKDKGNRALLACY